MHRNKPNLFPSSLLPLYPANNNIVHILLVLVRCCFLVAVAVVDSSDCSGPVVYCLVNRSVFNDATCGAVVLPFWDDKGPFGTSALQRRSSCGRHGRFHRRSHCSQDTTHLKHHNCPRCVFYQLWWLPPPQITECADSD